jgi:hypothetical protein
VNDESPRRDPLLHIDGIGEVKHSKWLRDYTAGAPSAAVTKLKHFIVLLKENMVEILCEDIQVRRDPDLLTLVRSIFERLQAD